MNNTYFDLIDQTYYFPQEGFDLQDGNLTFHDVPIKYLIEKYGTPMKLTYLPKVGMQIKRAKNLFNHEPRNANHGENMSSLLDMMENDDPSNVLENFDGDGLQSVGKIACLSLRNKKQLIYK